MFGALLWLGFTVAVTQYFRVHPPQTDRLRILALLLPSIWALCACLGLVWSFASVTGLVLWPDSVLMVGSSVTAPAVFVLLVPRAFRGVVAGTLLCFLATLVFADQPYLRYFGTVVPIAALGAAGQVPHLGESVRALLDPADAVFGVWALSGLVFAVRWSRQDNGLGRARRWVYTVMLGFPLGLWALAAPATFVAGFGFTSPNRVVVQKNLLGRWGVLNVHAFGLYQLVRDSLVRDGLSETEAQRIDSVVAARVEEHPSTVDEWFGRAKGADLLLIHLESVQGFVVGAQYAEQPITPFLDRWMGTEAIRFDEIYDQTHQGRTSDAQFMVFNGLHPFEQGSVVFQRENNRFVALPSVLGAAGYSTAAAFPYERGFWNTARMFQAWGFESARYAEDFGVGEQIGWGLADHAFFDQMLDPLLTAQRPAFHYLVPLSLHFPYADFPAAHKRLRLGDLEGSALGNYLHAVHHLDASLEALFAALEAEGRLAHTLVVLYGDHDWGLPLDDAVRQLAAFSQSPELLLDRVPLVIRLPDGSERGVVETVGGHVDVGPTVLHLLGLERPASMLGTSLLPERSRAVALPNGSAVSATQAWVAGAEIWQPEGRARGQAIADAGCWDRLTGTQGNDEDCAALSDRAREELRAARDIVWFDQAARLAGQE